MKHFTHLNAYSIEEANELLIKYKGKAKLIAGGTDLLGAMKDKIISEYPQAIINIKTIENLDYIKEDERGIAIGTLTKLSDLANSPIVKKGYALLGEAAHSVATPGIRNMATIGGNMAQDVRCWYYRYPDQIGGAIICLRKGGKGCDALTGDNRYHSIFGGKGCFAVNPSDIAVALIALNATVVTNKRTVPSEVFFTTNTTTSTVLEVDEIITEIKIPKSSDGTRQHYIKFTLRKPVDFSVVSAASVITINEDVCSDARVVLGAVASAPLRALKAEEFLIGKRISEKTAEEAAQIALKGARPLSRNGYKVKIASALVKRTILGQTAA
jgi:xanthine dehydrogenase YagS FAD-binding subunit